MAAGLRDDGAGRKDPWTDEEATIDGPCQRRVRAASVAHRGKAAHEVRARRVAGHRADHPWVRVKLILRDREGELSSPPPEPFRIRAYADPRVLAEHWGDAVWEDSAHIFEANPGGVLG